MVTAVEEMKKVISLADIMKVSDEESLLLTGASNYEDASDEFLKMGEDGNKISCNYTGKAGGYYWQERIKEKFLMRSLLIRLDTTGAGDSFWGGFLSRLLSIIRQ